MNEISLTEETNFQLNSLEKQCSPTQHEPRSKSDPGKAVNDDSVVFVKNLNEIVTIEESPSTQELYKHIVNIKEELRNQPLLASASPSKKAKNVMEVQNANLICADCEEVVVLLDWIKFML